MFKSLLIILLSAYLLSKIGRFLLAFNPSRTREQYRPTDDNINVKDRPAKGKKGSTIKGGEYVDFEEVK